MSSHWFILHLWSYRCTVYQVHTTWAAIGLCYLYDHLDVQHTKSVALVMHNAWVASGLCYFLWSYRCTAYQVALVMHNAWAASGLCYFLWSYNCAAHSMALVRLNSPPTVINHCKELSDTSWNQNPFSKTDAKWQK
jgi:hypothetical protein